MIESCYPATNALLTVEEALERLVAIVIPVSEAETMVLDAALGRVLSHAVFSPIDIPYDTNAAMDGYAFNSRNIDLNQTFSLQLRGTSWAGRPYQGQLETGDCIRIYTGAVVPTLADSVVMQEQVRAEGGIIHFPAGTKAGQNIRCAGEDVVENSLLLDKGRKLNAADIALLAAAGIAEITVNRRIDIAYFATGDELMALGQAPETGKIYDSNRYGLAGLLNDPCFRVTDLGRIGDDKNDIEVLLLDAAEHFDVILSTGGASVGEADYISEILRHCGLPHFWKIALKPGKPLAFGTINRSYFFGLPGNPLSVFVTFQQIVAPALRRLAGALPARRLRIKATCTSPIKKAAGRQEFVCGLLTQDENGNFFVTSAGAQGSHKLALLSKGQCYIVLPSASQGVRPGEEVIVEPFDLLW